MHQSCIAKIIKGCIVCFVLCWISNAMEGAKNYLSFDYLYPKSNYEKVLNNIMSFWSGAKKSAINRYNFNSMNEGFVRLCKLRRNIEIIIAENHYSRHDISYIKQLFHVVLLNYYQSFNA